jgi:hypothetical protein
MAEKIVLFNGVNAIGQQVIPKPWLPMSILTIGSLRVLLIRPQTRRINRSTGTSRPVSIASATRTVRCLGEPKSTKRPAARNSTGPSRRKSITIVPLFTGLAILGQWAAVLQGFCLLSNQYQDRHS